MSATDEEQRVLYVEPAVPGHWITPIERKVLEGLGMQLDPRTDDGFKIHTSATFGHDWLEIDESIESIIDELCELAPQGHRPDWVHALIRAAESADDGAPEMALCVETDAVPISVADVLQGILAGAQRNGEKDPAWFNITAAVMGPLVVPQWVGCSVTRVMPDRQVHTDLVKAPAAQAAAEDLRIACESSERVTEDRSAGSALESAYNYAVQATQ